MPFARPRRAPVSPQTAAMKVIAFVNVGSGGNEGAKVLKMLADLLGPDHVFDIKKDGGPGKGLDAHRAAPGENVRCLVAGGDGTFSWVASVLEEKEIGNVYLSLIPLGSGNDMSRALGWGRKYPGDAEIPRFVEFLRNAPLHPLDVWKLAAEADPNVEGSGGETGNVRPLMCNYLSFGADAYVELKFNQLRWNNPEKYKSRLGNFRAHAVVGTKYLMKPRKRKYFVAEHVEEVMIDGKPIDIPPRLQALIILNIPSYGAGTQPWGTVGGRSTSSDISQEIKVVDMVVNDGCFEVIGLTGLPQFGSIKVLGTNGMRIGQGTSLKVTLKPDATPFQVDGEPWEQRGGVVTMEKGNPVGVLVGPVWKANSKKNAKFTGDGGDSVGSPVSQPAESGDMA